MWKCPFSRNFANQKRARMIGKPQKTTFVAHGRAANYPLIIPINPHNSQNRNLMTFMRIRLFFWFFAKKGVFWFLWFLWENRQKGPYLKLICFLFRSYLASICSLFVSFLFPFSPLFRSYLFPFRSLFSAYLFPFRFLFKQKKTRPFGPALSLWWTTTTNWNE